MANPVILEPQVKQWYCPSCGATKATKEALPHTPYHHCAKMRGVAIPFIEAHIKAALRLNEREDYLNGEDQPRDDQGRAVMSVTVQREDGEDCFAFAPSARRAAADYD